MIIKNIIIEYNNGYFHIEEVSRKTKNYNKNELKLNSIISDVLSEILEDEEFIKKSMSLKKEL